MSTAFATQGNEKDTALLVMSQARSSQLRQQLEACGFDVVAVSRREEGRRILQSRSHFEVVLADRVLPDGDWRGVLQDVAECDTAAPVIIYAGPEADTRLWLDVLDGGAYDLLVEPYDPRDGQRVIENAARKGRRRDAGRSGDAVA